MRRLYLQNYLQGRRSRKKFSPWRWDWTAASRPG